MAITWGSDKAEHLTRHGVTTAQADEAFYDVDAIVINPDYASSSGRGVRTIGYSASFGDLLAVLTLVDGGITFGNTAFRAKRKDRRYYYQEWS